MAALAARMGVCGDRSDTSGQIDVDAQAATEQIVAIIRKRMTPELIAAISTPQGLEQLDFHVGKTLDNIVRWFGPK